MPTEPTLSDLVATTARGVEEMRSKYDAITGALGKLEGKFDDLDGLDKDTVTKASEAAGTALQGVRDLEARVKSDEWTKSISDQAEQLRDIQFTLANGRGSSKAIPDNASDYHRKCDPIFRSPKKRDSWAAMMGDDVLAAEAAKLIDLYMPHMSDENRATATKTLVGGFATDGGVFVPVERDQNMVTRIFESSPIRQLCSVMTTGTNMVEFVIDDDELSAVWGGELSTIGNTDTPNVGLLKIEVNDLYARPMLTQNIIEDASIDIVSWLNGHASRRFARAENTAHVTGNDAESPRGILSYAASTSSAYQRDAIERVRSGASGGFGDNGVGLIRLQNSLKQDYQNGAAWLAKRATFGQLAQLRDDQGQYLFRYGDALAQGFGMTVLGQPLFFADDMPSVANDALAVAYGNFQAGYQIVDRVGITVLPDMVTVFPKVRYNYRRRTGGAVVNFEAIKLLQLAA